MYIRMIPNKITKNNIISTQKRKMIVFQNTNGLVPDRVYATYVCAYSFFVN